MLIAAPLLVLSRPLETMLWAWPATARKALGAFFSSAGDAYHLAVFEWRSGCDRAAGSGAQLAGLLMWIPGGLVHAIAALVLLGTLLKDSTERAVQGNACQ